MQARYPEAETIFQYVYVLLIKEVGDDASAATGTAFPHIEEAYHVFLCRMCACPDVCKGETFFSLSLLERRIVYIECFRNALHDILRRRTGGRPAMGGPAAPVFVVASVREPPELASATTPPASEDGSRRQASSFREAVACARDRSSSVAPSETPSKKSERSQGLGTSRSAPAAPPLPVVVTPAAEGSDSEEKCVAVSRSPCFFEDGEDDGRGSVGAPSTRRSSS